MSEQRSIIQFRHYQEAAQKFEYFVVGVAGALCAYVSQHLPTAKLGMNTYTLEVIALGSLVCSVIAGFKRIESMNLVTLGNSKILDLGEKQGALMKSLSEPGQGSFLNEETGAVRTREQTATDVKELGQQLKQRRAEVDKWKDRSKWLYDVRNWLLAAGFLGLVLARVLTPYWGSSAP